MFCGSMLRTACSLPALCFGLLRGHVQCGSPGIQATAVECSGAMRAHTRLRFQTDLGAWYVIEFGLINSLSRGTTIADRALGVMGGWKSGAKREHQIFQTPTSSEPLTPQMLGAPEVGD